MDAVFRLIEGSFGALVMVVFGLLSVATSPLVIIVPILALSNKGTNRKIWLLLAIPAVCLTLAVGMFILRASIALFFYSGPVSVLLL